MNGEQDEVLERDSTDLAQSHMSDRCLPGFRGIQALEAGGFVLEGRQDLDASLRVTTS